jgi:hypothetical protein
MRVITLLPSADPARVELVFRYDAEVVAVIRRIAPAAGTQLAVAGSSRVTSWIGCKPNSL